MKFSERNLIERRWVYRIFFIRIQREEVKNKFGKKVKKDKGYVNKEKRGNNYVRSKKNMQG